MWKLHFLRKRLSPGPNTSPNCLADMKNEKVIVLLFLSEVRDISPNRTAPALTPIPNNNSYILLFA